GDLRTVDVPAGEVGVHRVTLVRGVDSPVEAGILTVHIGKDVRLDQRVVHGGVERRGVVGGAAFDDDLVQLVVPRLARGRGHGVERLLGVLRLQVGLRAVDGYKGQSDLDVHRGTGEVRES